MICKKCGQVLGEGTKICPICKAVQDETMGQEEIHNIEENETRDTLQTENVEEYYESQAMQASHNSSLFEDMPIRNNQEERYPYPPRSRVLAGMLQIFLGGFGIGRFYLGYNGIALGQLFTMPIFFIGNIWGIIDGILILCGQVEYDANGVPLA